MRSFLAVAAVATLACFSQVPVALGQSFGVSGSFVGLRSTGQLDVIATSSLDSVSQTITTTRTDASSALVGVARRPANGLFYFLDRAGQLYSSDVDAAIQNGENSVTLTAVGSASAPRATGTENIGFAFNPVGDRIRITNANTNFRVNPADGAPGGGAADGSVNGNTFSYQESPVSANPVNLVATAYTNQAGKSPRDAVADGFGTVQYGIDAANDRWVRFNNSNEGIISNSGVELTGLEAGSDLTGDVGLTVVSQLNGAGNVIVATIPTGSGNGAYTIDAASGVATAITGSALDDQAYVGIAFTTAPVEESSSSSSSSSSTADPAPSSSSSSSSTAPDSSSSTGVNSAVGAAAGGTVLAFAIAAVMAIVVA